MKKENLIQKIETSLKLNINLDEVFKKEIGENRFITVSKIQDGAITYVELYNDELCKATIYLLNGLSNKKLKTILDKIVNYKFNFICEILQSLELFDYKDEIIEEIILLKDSFSIKQLREIYKLLNIDNLFSFYDNNGETFDRITIIFKNKKDSELKDCIASSNNGDGFFQHSTAIEGKHLGKKISFIKLNESLQNKILKIL